jgi:hypothetical protein
VGKGLVHGTEDQSPNFKDPKSFQGTYSAWRSGTPTLPPYSYSVRSPHRLFKISSTVLVVSRGITFSAR